MAFLRKVALRPVPSHAVVGEHVVAALEQDIRASEDELQAFLDDGYRLLDRRQPRLGAWLAEQVAAPSHEVAQSLGYFLAVVVFLAFREAFPTRLREVTEEGLRLAMQTLETDEELRAADPREVLKSDDVIAMGQPALVELVQHHVHDAMEQARAELEPEDVSRIYRSILLEVVALSHAVASPSGHVGPPRELLA